jgi:hypothetical protein
LPSIFNPWLSIPLRSLLIIGLFCIPLFRFSLSKEIETLFEKLIKRLF